MLNDSSFSSFHTLCQLLRARILNQSDPFYYNHLGVIISNTLVLLAKLNSNNEESRNQINELIKDYKDLEILFIKNHPWSELCFSEEDNKNLISYDFGKINQSQIILQDELTFTLPIKIGWLFPIEQLKILHHKLFLAGKINCEEDLFISHFVGNLGTIEKIQWTGKDTELVHLFSELIRKDIIPDHYNYIIILCQHFCKKNLSSFNKDSLRVLKTRSISIQFEKFISKTIKAITEYETSN